VPDPTVYPATVLRVAPHALPDLRAALDTVLAELRPVLQRMRYEGWIREPWRGDSESHRMWQSYNRKVMTAEDGPFKAMLAYEGQLVAVRDRLVEIEEAYRRTEGDNSDLWGRL
jgi:hypothetical protein